VEAVYTRLPVPAWPLVGRAREVEEIRQLIVEEGARLVTLSGPGGVGKTRLALAAATLLEPEFAEGVRFVDLAPLSDPGLVPSAIGRACGLIHDNAQAPMRPLTRALRDRELLLLIDNFEQVVDAATELGQLVEACPRLRIIVTSREPLRLRSEWEYPVEPLPLPRIPAGGRTLSREDVDAIAHNPSVALFVQRARAVRPNFALAADNARALADVCIRLDGLPLAIELAAARTRFVPANAVALRLERPLDLQSGLRDAPERHRTLREAIAWSYALLLPEQRTVFNRMAVFAGGCSLAAAQVVCRSGDQPSADGMFGVLGDLIERSLLLTDDAAEGEVRFRLLQTVREFALERLEASGQAEAARSAHAAYFEGLVAEAVPRLAGSEQRAWLDVLANDLDNLRAALRWLVSTKSAAQHALRRAAELNWRLWPFWWARGYLAEARRWSQVILEQPAAAPTDRARAAWVASTAALDEGDYAAAPALVAECLGVFRGSGDAHGLARALLVEGWAAPIGGDLQRAIEAHQEGMAQFRQAGDETGVILALAGLGNTAMLMHDLPAAERYNAEALALARRLGDTHSQAQVLEATGLLILERGDPQRAAATFVQSIELCLEVGSLELFCYCLVGLAGVALAERALERSACLLGAAEGLRERAGLGAWPVRSEVEQRYAAQLRRAFGERRDTLERAWLEGRGLTLHTAANLARQEDAARTTAARPVDTAQTRRLAEVGAAGELTTREVQVAALIAQGKTSKEIADELVISERTADTHAAHIRDKLDVRSRAEIAAWVVRRGLNGSQR
jgi:predicted ATPase/DNA-binding CsgD family transcriptional regulator